MYEWPVSTCKGQGFYGNRYGRRKPGQQHQSCPWDQRRGTYLALYEQGDVSSPETFWTRPCIEHSKEERYQRSQALQSRAHRVVWPIMFSTTTRYETIKAGKGAETKDLFSIGMGNLCSYDISIERAIDAIYGQKHTCIRTNLATNQILGVGLI